MRRPHDQRGGRGGGPGQDRRPSQGPQPGGASGNQPPPPPKGNLPLYAQAREAVPSASGDGNAGLWWDKFCDQWREDWSGLSKPDQQSKSDGGKQLWIRQFAKSGAVGDKNVLAEMHERRKAMLAKFGREPLELALQGPFVTGTGLDHPVENGFLWHHTLGVPYLPSSGVKGLARAWAEQVLKPNRATTAEDIDRIFGPETGAKMLGVGSVIFLDALPVEPVALTMEVMTPHYQPWYQATDPAKSPPADWYDPNPIPFLAVEPGARFAFALLPNPNARATPEQAEDDVGAVEIWLKDALSWLGAGAKTATGFGRFGEPEIADVRNGKGSGGKSPPPPPPPPARYSVDGDAVDIVRRERGLVLVRYRRGGRETWVEPDEIEELP